MEKKNRIFQVSRDQTTKFKSASEFRRYKKLIVKPCLRLAFSREICKSSSNITDVFIGSWGSRKFNSSISQSNTALARNGQRCPGPRFHAGCVVLGKAKFA